MLKGCTLIHSVLISNEFYQVNTHQRSKTIWVAVGDYNKRSITVRGRSVYQAIELWKKAAEHVEN